MNRAASHRTHHAAAPALGFTLLEVILATMLLALGLAIAFASLHAANASVRRSEQVAARNEHLRAVQEFLYRTLRSAQPLVLERDPASRQAYFFKGAHDQAAFVAPMPGYLSRGGPYVLTLKLVPAAMPGTQHLQFTWAMLVNEQPLAADAQRPAEALLDGIASGHFEYRGLGADGKIGAWQTSWERVSEMPLQMRLRLRFVDPAQVWPAFATALPLGFASARAEGNGDGAIPADASGGGP